MHKNYRRKNPRESYYTWWRNGGKFKKEVLKNRSRARRQRDRVILRKTINDRNLWKEIRKFEEPVDWWAIW